MLAGAEERNPAVLSREGFQPAADVGRLELLIGASD
jgi:hypothetical protein